MKSKDFLPNMAGMDELIDHNIEDCGQCFHQYLMAQVAREMLAAGATGDVKQQMSAWSDEVKKRWEAGKYFKLWQEELAAGRDPNILFEEKGWEP